MNEQSIPRRMTWKNYLAYGVGDFYGGGAFTLINVLFLKYLTDVALLPAALAGLVLLIGNVWDGGIDPFIGMITDHTRSRHGRRRVFFLGGILPIVVTFVLLWTPVRGAVVFKTFYSILVYLLYALAYSFVMVPYNALPADMSEEYAERNRLMGVRMAFSNFASLVVSVLPMMIIVRAGYPVMGLTFGVLFALPWIAVFRGTWERPATVLRPRQRAASVARTVAEDLWKTLRNRTFRLHMGLYLFGYAALDFMMALAMYFIADYLGIKGRFSAVMGTLVICQIVGLPLYVKISNRFGKRNAFLLGAFIWAAAMLSVLFMSPGQPWYYAVMMAAVAGFGASAVAYVPWAILPEVADVDELLYGERREGVYAGCMSILRKAAQGLALFLIGLVLQGIGYDPVHLTKDALLAIKLLFGIGPVVLLVAAAFFAARYPVSPETHGLMMSVLERLRAGGSLQDEDAETRDTCRALMGNARRPAKTRTRMGAGTMR